MDELLKNNLLVDDKLCYEKLNKFRIEIIETIKNNIVISERSERQIDSLIHFFILSVLYLYYCCCKDDFTDASIIKLTKCVFSFQCTDCGIDTFDILLSELFDPHNVLDMEKEDFQFICSELHYYNYYKDSFPDNAEEIFLFVFKQLKKSNRL